MDETEYKLNLILAEVRSLLKSDDEFNWGSEATLVSGRLGERACLKISLSQP
jgi:hypothetical protein